MRDFLLDCLSGSICHVATASGESDYDDDNTDRQSQKHKPGSSAKAVEEN